MTVSGYRGRLRKAHRGANMALLCILGVMLIGIMGICIYLGLQAYVHDEISKAASTAAMSGASVFYSSGSTRPSPNSGMATSTATKTFNTIVANSGALKGFGIKLTGVSTSSSNDSVTVNAEGSLPTAFLSVVGINKIDVTATGTARALKYEPTQFVGPVSILPKAGDANSMTRTIKLVFPLVDGPGVDMYVEQGGAQQPYAVEACNDSACYDLVPGATPIGSGRVLTVNGTQMIIGTAVIDLEKAKVRKASAIRITHGNTYGNKFAGGATSLNLYPTPLVVTRVMLFGYSGLCASPTECPIPAGFSPVNG